MSADSVTSDVTAATSLLADVTDDSCKLEFDDPCARDADGPSATECVTGDWSAEVKQEILPIVKQEPEQACYTVKHYPVWRPVFAVDAAK